MMNVELIAGQLEKTGYIIADNLLSEELLLQLLARCQDDDPARFHAAHIGRGADKQLINSIRGDVISWLDESDPVDRCYLDVMETFRAGINAALFLGLFEYECHYAIYGAGAGYAKHSDVLSGKRNRVLTTVLYLNKNWQPGDGGELVLYDETGEAVLATVEPKFGTMVIFLSEVFPHEVRVSHTTRHSLTGWFRVSGS